MTGSDAPRRLGQEFFRRDAATVARALLGCVLVRHVGGDAPVRRARVVEAEAYVGPHDLACHASKGRTPRTAVMFGPAGRAYVYLIYGIHEMFNIVTGAPGCPGGEAVLLRAAEPLSGWPPAPRPDLSGLGKLCRALAITRALNGTDVTADALHFEPPPPAAPAPRIIATPRIGVDYAGDWAARPLRFLDADSPFVSAARPARRRRPPG